MLQIIIILEVYHPDRRYRCPVLIDLAVGIGADLLVIGIQPDAAAVLIQNKISVLRHEIPLCIHGKITVPRVLHGRYICLVRVFHKEKARAVQREVKDIICHLDRSFGIIRVVLSHLHTQVHARP